MHGWTSFVRVMRVVLTRRHDDQIVLAPVHWILVLVVHVLALIEPASSHLCCNGAVNLEESCPV